MNKQNYHEALAMIAARGLVASPYRYYKDRYSLELLQGALPEDDSAVPVAALKRSRWSYLLDKPKIANLVRRLRGAPLTRNLLHAHDCASEEVNYRVAVSSWGGWDERESQTSRKGANLVVHLNFDRAHDLAFEKLVKPERGNNPFRWSSYHPHSRSRNTMAWARVDFDLARGEALIEEIQSDWLREAARAANRADWALTPDPRGKRRRFAVDGVRGSAQQVLRYHANHILPHLSVWSEAVLAVALRVVVRGLGIRQVYFHSLESGKGLRDARWWDPPASLYTDLPRRFGFKETREPPAFLAGEDHIRKLADTGTLPPLFAMQF
jgi:hypothetical protein